MARCNAFIRSCRRRAYRQMAEMLGGPALACYDTVFGREPESTRHYSQDWTPKLDKPIQPKVLVK